MKKRNVIGLILAVIVIIPTIAFVALTPKEEYVQVADPVIYNVDSTNSKQRPFIVDKKEYPFKSNWFELNGTSMHYIDEGEGIPVVLCHGNPDWSFLYRNIIKELSGECRLIAYDLPGFGFSDTPPNFNFTPQEHAEWVNALVMDHLKLDKFIIVVQDWGGPIGLTVATNNANHVLGTVISNTWAWKVDGGIKNFSYAMRTSMAERLVMNKNYFATNLMKGALPIEKQENKAITDAYKMAFPTKESRLGTIVFPQQITIASEWLGELENRLPSLSDKPVEFIFGQKDFTVGAPDVIEKWKSIYPHAPVKLLPEANHFTQENSPESFVTSIRRILKQVE